MSTRRCRHRAVVGLLFAAGCTITSRVDPVPARAISSVCIVENDKVWGKDFLPALRDRFARRGITTTVYQGPLPADCVYRLEYDARWKWDVAAYLGYADIRLYEGDTQIGRAMYDARDGDARLDKFGRGEAKVAKLMDALLQDVNRTPPDANSTSSAR